jgi:signal transduction histidine kinase
VVAPVIGAAAGRTVVAARPRARHLGWRHLGWTVAAAAIVLVAASRVLLARDPFTLLGQPGPPTWLWVGGQAAGPVLGVGCVSVLGGVVVARRAAGPLGWALLGTALAAGLTLFCQEYAVYALVTAPGSLPAAAPAAWAQVWSYHLLMLGVVVGLLLFPDGRLAGRVGRVVALLAAVVTVLALLDSLGNSQTLNTTVRDESYPLPVTMPPGLWALGGAFASWSGVPVYWAQALLLPAGAAGLLERLRRASPLQRQQVKWVAFGGAVAGAGWLVSYADQMPSLVFGPAAMETIDSWGDLLWIMAIALVVPLAAGVGVLRYRLYEIDLVINRTVLVAGLAAFIAGIYGLVVGGIGSAVHSSYGPWLGLLATSVAAVGFAPMRAGLQALGNRLVYGRRASPYEVLADFAERLGAAGAGEDVLGLMARLLGAGLGAERTEVWLRVGQHLRLAAAWPEAVRGAVALPLSGSRLPPELLDGVVLVRDRDELLGALRVAKRPGEQQSPHERRLLEDLARQAGLVMRATRLIEELRESRERIVGAHDEVRRRLERDLHDGAQQRLVSASMALAMVGSQLDEGRVGEAGAGLTDAVDQLRLGLAELRDLARGIHPAILTDVGLAPAIESLVERSQVPAELAVSIGRRLPVPVETSAYYFVAEALTNVAKHARASMVRVRAAHADGMLRIEVADDGVGGADRERGSGLRGLDDRLAALGGRLRIDSPPLGGTRLRAELPCA